MNDEVTVLDCNDILCLEQFVEKAEKEGIGRMDGVFKIRFASEHLTNSNLPAVLSTVSGRVKDLHSQIVLKGNAENIYQYKRIEAKREDKREFVLEASKMTSFTTKTCCSIILEDSGCDKLMQHYFEDEIKERAIRTDSNWTDVDQTMRNLLQQGAALRKTYENKETDLLFEQCLKKPKQPAQCDCSYCLDEITEIDSDLDCDKTSSNLLYACGVSLDKHDKPIFITRNFSLSRIKNILLLLDRQYPGITSPYFYLGKKHTFFPLHLEDASLWSINFLHFGQPKIWFVIPSEAVLMLMYHLSKSKLSIGNTSCWNFLGHKTAFPDPAWLKERKIPFKVVVQNAGEAVILYPDAAHYGFNTGWNLAEAVNFATISWIQHGVRSLRCICTPLQVHLDLGKIVAAFRPDLLPQWLKGTHVTNPNEEDTVKIMQAALKVRVQQGDIQNATGSGLNMEDHISGEEHRKEKGIHQRNKTQEKKEINLGKNLEKEEDKYLKCPLDTCKKKYKLQLKKRLVIHVKNNHRPLLSKKNLLEKIEEQHWQLKTAAKN